MHSMWLTSILRFLLHTKRIGLRVWESREMLVVITLCVAYSDIWLVRRSVQLKFETTVNISNIAEKFKRVSVINVCEISLPGSWHIIIYFFNIYCSDIAFEEKLSINYIFIAISLLEVKKTPPTQAFIWNLQTTNIIPLSILWFSKLYFTECIKYRFC